MFYERFIIITFWQQGIVTYNDYVGRLLLKGFGVHLHESREDFSLCYSLAETYYQTNLNLAIPTVPLGDIT